MIQNNISESDMTLKWYNKVGAKIKVPSTENPELLIKGSSLFLNLEYAKILFWMLQSSIT